MKKYILIIIISVLAVTNMAFSQELHTPYPIVFIHGIVGDQTTWYSPDEYDIIDFLTEPLSNTPLTFGDVLRVTLDSTREPRENTIFQDVHLFNGTPNKGDLYIINFNVHANGNVATYGAVGHVTDPIILPMNGTGIIHVNNYEQYQVGDIIRIEDEFLKVVANLGSELVVVRGYYDSSPGIHEFYDVIYNLSNESNQADISKQGYGVKLAIDAIKSVTGRDSVILVCHSMGGLSAREYIRFHYGNDVMKIVTIGTPHYGSNLAEMPESYPYFVADLDPRSSGVRDLASGVELFFGLYNDLGVYLFGGNEETIEDQFYSDDVNCNLVTDYVQGLNQNYSNLLNINRTWIVSSYIGPSWLIGPNDGIVLTESQYIDNADTIRTISSHCSPLPGLHESINITALIRGLDEPNEAFQAYEIRKNSSNKGFVSMQHSNNPTDIDFYKVNIISDGMIVLSMLADEYSGVDQFGLLNANLESLVTVAGYSESISYNVSPGYYYIRIQGTAVAEGPDNIGTINRPYTLQSNFTPSPPQTLSTSPKNLVEFYDVVLSNYREQTVTLNNTSTSNITVSNILITGSDATQFSVTSPLSFDVPPMGNAIITVRFNPLLVDSRSAVLEIENTSEVPLISIQLHGNGVSSPTRKLIVSPDLAYNFGNVYLNSERTKIIQLKNIGSDPVTVTNFSLEGLNPESYFILSQPSTPLEIETGEIEQITLRFAPQTIGTKIIELLISNNSDNASPNDTLALYGVGKNSVLTGIYNTITAYEYWFDDQFQSKTSVSCEPVRLKQIALNLETSTLATGLHRINVRFKDNTNKWSSIITEPFYKRLPEPVVDNSLNLTEYWFDTLYSSKVNSPISNQDEVFINETIEPSGLNTGLHRINTRFKDVKGRWSSVLTEPFFVKPIDTIETNLITQAEYWIDDAYPDKELFNITSTNDLTIGESLAYDSLATGQHYFNTRFRDTRGLYSSVLREPFYKHGPFNTIPNLISEYRYWYDDTYSPVQNQLEIPTQDFVLNDTVNVYPLDAGNHRIHYQFRDISGWWSSVVTDTFNFQGYSINGFVKYNNQQLTPIDSARILLKLNGAVVDSAFSANDGSFIFEHKQNGTYLLEVITTKPWNGVNSTDALKIQRHIAEIELINEPIRLVGADVNASNSINATDAVKVKRRIAGIDNSFVNGDWLSMQNTGNPYITINGANINCQLYSLCIGDVNGSNIPE